MVAPAPPHLGAELRQRPPSRPASPLRPDLTDGRHAHPPSLHHSDERAPLLAPVPRGKASLLQIAVDRERPGMSRNKSDLLDSSSGIERPATPRSLMQHAYLSHPSTTTEMEFDIERDGPASTDPTFVSAARGGPLPVPTRYSRVRLRVTQFLSNAASAVFLLLIVFLALSARFFEAVLPWRWKKSDPKNRPWDDPKRWRKEKLVKDPGYYARTCGFDIVNQTIETEDGYFLRVHKIVVPGRDEVGPDGRGGYPVIIQHGLFQSSGSFVTSEERSLAFWLAKHGGYQVYLSNARGVFDMGHKYYKRSDPRFWDYNIGELALYDMPAVVDHVRRETGYDTVAFIGHSQGNATMFCSLARGMKPDLAGKLSCFIALAPAVYAGPLTTGFPFNVLKSMGWKTWRRVFGVLDFVPLMTISYNYVPSLPFALLGYQMFSKLFNWSDRNWLPRRKAKMFRFTPSPVSSASVYWWTGLDGFSTRGCVLNPKVDCWYDKGFPPLSLYHGDLDYLVLIDPLLKRLRENEPHVPLLRVQGMEMGEHCDTFWHVDAVELCYPLFVEDIEKTRPR